MVPGWQKLLMVEAFLESTDLLEKPLTRIQRNDSKEELGAREEKQRWQKKQVCYFLYAIVFELAIKMIWEVENGNESKHTHDILRIYRQLSHEKQSKIKELYDAQASLVRDREIHLDGNPIHLDEFTEYQSLEDALQANYETVVNFKYDGIYQDKSSVIGSVVWNKERNLYWLLREEYVVFPKALVKYAKEQVESQLTEEHIRLLSN